MNKELTPQQGEELLAVLQKRFEKNMHRHLGVKWADVQARLNKNSQKLWSLSEMERTGGEPDVVSFNFQTTQYLFCDCSAESPKGRRSLCYDQDSHASRKEHKPRGSAVGLAQEMGIELLTQELYQELQKLESFDTKSSSWVQTPESIRKLGGAVFADFRYKTVFFYHNGAESYYAARGFRGLLRV